nr:MAG TPA: hypothetical protein [Caudoviricetes sp.]
MVISVVTKFSYLQTFIVFIYFVCLLWYFI